MVAISQTTFLNAFLMNMFECRSKVHGGLFLRVQFTIFSIGVIIWTNDFYINDAYMRHSALMS